MQSDARRDTLKRLLRETTRPMDEVADLSGFPGARRMAKVFRRELRCAPREYRRAVAAET
jgi:transcriptional regulator GlxA family with amidase domain